MMLAGDTVPPPPGDAIVAARPRRAGWPVVAAAAVVAVGAHRRGRGRRAAGPDPVLDDDQVPSLFGYDAAARQPLLADRGPAGRPAPDAGLRAWSAWWSAATRRSATRFRDGDTVTIRTAVPSDVFCMARYPGATRRPGSSCDWAVGRGPAPEFADDVDVVVDGSDPVRLTGAEAADRDRWGDPGVLTTLADAVGEVYAVPGTTDVPHAAARRGD